jgi:hypothetical protein
MMNRFLCAAGVLVLVVGSALAQNNKQEATVKMVDPDKGKMLIAVVKDGGISVKEVDIGKNVKFMDENGKPMKDGLKSDAFKSKNDRPAVPITMKFDKSGNLQSIQLRKEK